MNGDLDVLKRLRLATRLFDNLIRSSRFADYVLSGGTGEPVPCIDDMRFFNNVPGGHMKQLKEAVESALSAASLGLAMAAAELTSSSSSCSIDKLAKSVATLCRVCAFLILFMQRFLKPEVFSDAADFEMFRLWYTLSAAKSGLLVKLEEVCKALTLLFKSRCLAAAAGAQQQQQQQQQSAFSELEVVALSTLTNCVTDLLRITALKWPNPLALFSPQLAPAVVAAAAMLVAALRLGIGASSAHNVSSMGGSSSSSTCTAATAGSGGTGSSSSSSSSIDGNSSSTTNAASFHGKVGKGTSSGSSAIETFMSFTGGPETAIADVVLETTIPSTASPFALGCCISMRMKLEHILTTREPCEKDFSSETLVLVLMVVGLTTKAAHQRYRDEAGAVPAAAGNRLQSPPQPQQQQQVVVNVPPYHEQLLEKLGVPVTVSLPLHRYSAVIHPAFNEGNAAAFDGWAEYVRLSNRNTLGSSSATITSSSSSSSGGPLSMGCTLSMKDVLMPLLLVLLEDVVVKPGLRNAKVRLETMLKLLNRLQLLQLETFSEAQQVDLQREVAAVFLPAMVQFLLPAVRETAAAAAAAAAAGNMNDDSVGLRPHLPSPAAAAAAGLPEGSPSARSSLEHLKLQLSTVLGDALDVVLPSHDDDPSAVMMTKNCSDQLLASTEAFFRSLSVVGCVNSTQADMVQARIVFRLLNGVLLQLYSNSGGAAILGEGSSSCQTVQQARTGCDGDLAVAPSSSPAAAAEALATCCSLHPESLPVFSFICTSLKMFSGRSRELITAADENWARAMRLMLNSAEFLAEGAHIGSTGNVSAPVHSCMVDGDCSRLKSSSNPDSSSSGSGSSSGSSYWWCYLLIRNLIVSAAGSFGSTSIPSNNSFRLRRVTDWVYVLKSIDNAFAAVAALPGQQHVLAAALPAAEVQRVTAQQAQLLVEAEQLQLTIADNIPFHIRSQVTSSNVTWDGLAQALDEEAEKGPTSAGHVDDQQLSARFQHLAEQLVGLGAEMCALLPVPLCCNYHKCSNMDKLSEMELVSGKSCVCGGCRAARYCSSACQKAHWLDWHKPVCKRIKTAAAAAAADQAASRQDDEL